MKKEEEKEEKGRNTETCKQLTTAGMQNVRDLSSCSEEESSDVESEVVLPELSAGLKLVCA